LNVRLFVAVALPRDVRDALADWRPRDDALRPVATDGLHVTLCFLGWCDEDRAQAIGAAATACAAPVGELAVGDALWLPRRRPSVLAVALEDPEGELSALQRCVAEAMVDAAGHEPEDRPFLPHVTVARVRRGARAPRGELPAPPALRFAAGALTVYRSHLGRGGARYEALAAAPLR
jgi:2'-5' RNA ligase